MKKIISIIILISFFSISSSNACPSKNILDYFILNSSDPDMALVLKFNGSDTYARVNNKLNLTENIISENCKMITNCIYECSVIMGFNDIPSSFYEIGKFKYSSMDKRIYDVYPTPKNFHNGGENESVWLIPSDDTSAKVAFKIISKK